MQDLTARILELDFEWKRSLEPLSMYLSVTSIDVNSGGIFTCLCMY